MRTLLLSTLLPLAALPLAACDGGGDTAGATKTDTSGDTATDTAADTAETGGDTADTADTDTAGDTAAGCPTTETAVCGTISGTEITHIFAVRMYPPTAPNPAGDLLFDPTVVPISLPYTYVMPADAFPPDHAAGEYDAVLVIDSDGDGVLKRDVDTSISYTGNPITVVAGTGTDDVDFVNP